MAKEHDDNYKMTQEAKCKRLYVSFMIGAENK